MTQKRKCFHAKEIVQTSQTADKTHRSEENPFESTWRWRLRRSKACWVSKLTLTELLKQKDLRRPRWHYLKHGLTVKSRTFIRGSADTSAPRCLLDLLRCSSWPPPPPPSPPQPHPVGGREKEECEEEEGDGKFLRLCAAAPNSHQPEVIMGCGSNEGWKQLSTFFIKHLISIYNII